MEQDTYAAIVVPLLLEKLPEQLRLTIKRGEDHGIVGFGAVARPLDTKSTSVKSTTRTHDSQGVLKMTRERPCTLETVLFAWVGTSMRIARKSRKSANVSEYY